MSREVVAWEKPVLRDPEKESHERKATFLELFFDLVFVAIVAEATGVLAAHPTFEYVGKFFFSFIPCWWCWAGHTFYNDRFETRDLSYRIFTFLYMIPSMGLAIHSHDPLGKQVQGFAIAYIISRLVLVLLWARSGYHNAIARGMTNKFVIFFSASVVLWTCSLFVDKPLKFVLWALGLGLDLAAPFFTMGAQKKLPRLSKDHFAERYALFVIIVTGESVMGSIHGVAKAAAETGHGEITLHQIVSGTLGLSLAFGIWWMYFVLGKPELNTVQRWLLLSWSYLHMSFLCGLIIGSAGVLNVVADHSSLGVRWMLVGGVSLALATLAVIDLSHEWRDGYDKVYTYVRLGLCVLNLPIAFLDVDSAVTLGAMVIAVTIQVILMSYRYFRIIKPELAVTNDTENPLHDKEEAGKPAEISEKEGGEEKPTEEKVEEEVVKIEVQEDAKEESSKEEETSEGRYTYRYVPICGPIPLYIRRRQLVADKA